MLSRLAIALMLSLIVLPRLVMAETEVNWFKVGNEARDRGMLVAILVTDPDCGHCKRLHNEFLDAPANRGTLEKVAVTREISRGEGGKVTDFDGERIRNRLFLARYQIFASPTLLLLSPEGELLASPIVGFNGAQAYRELVDRRLARAQANLASGERPNPAMVADVE